jgi:lysophospholipase L1-like esterase
MSAPSAEKRSGTLRLILINLAVLLVLVAVAEAAVRVRAVLRFGFAGGVEDILTVDRALRLRVPVAGKSLGPITINSLGFRGPEIPAAKPPGSIRIAFLGGSTTFCAEVSGNEATWPHQVWLALQSAFPGQRFDYVNAGVPGYGLDSLQKSLEYRVAPLDPDIIVIYEATNDLSSNSYDLARAAGLIEERPDQQRSWLSQYSLLLYLLEVNLNVQQNQDQATQDGPKLVVDPARLAAPFRRDLAAVVAAARREAPVVALVTFATQFRPGQALDRQLDAAGTSLYYMPYMSMEGLLTGFAAYNEVIRATARANDLLLIEAAAAIPGDKIHYRDAVHFTDTGAAAMARVVADSLIAAPALRAIMATPAPQAPPAPLPTTE